MNTLLAKMVATGSELLPSFQNVIKPKLMERCLQNITEIPLDYMNFTLEHIFTCETDFCF